MRSTTGEIESSSTWARTDYIEIDDNLKSVQLESVYPTDANALCFYTSTKTFMEGYLNPGMITDPINVPGGAKYMIYSGGLNGVKPPYTVLYGKYNTYVDRYLAEYSGIKCIAAKTSIGQIAGINAYPGNLIDIADCVDNKYINYAGGNEISGNGYFCTGYIPVTAGITYKANHGRNYAWYKSDRTYLSGASGTAIQSGITAPQDAAYIRFTVNKTSDGINTPAGLYFASASVYNDAITIPGLITEVSPWCYGKKINWIGDSIVDGQDFDEEVCSALGLIKATEYGINGSTIALKADGTDGRNALCVRYANMSNDADIVAVSCGTNDFEYAWCPIGTIDDPDDGTSNNTFYGALKTLCKGLIDKYPQKVIFFTTPIKRGKAFANGDGGTYTPDGVPTTPFSKNKYGLTLGDYADIIKEVCGYYSIPVLDMYRESLLNPHLSSQAGMFDDVLTHPNATGQKIMARRVAGWLTQLGYLIE